MPEIIPVFVNGRPHRVPAGSTLGSLLAIIEPDLLASLLGGVAIATDGRGIAIDPDAPMPAGSIFRVARSARGSEATDA